MGENGSPRWKQRAFYDYLRDVVALVNRIPLIRISVYDRVITDCQINTVGSILMNGTESDLDQIVKFIESNIDKVI